MSVRPVEPTKVCGKCKERKPWSAFHAKTRWPDGTVRQPLSYCKDCEKRRTRRGNRSQINRRYWARFKADVERYQDHLERRRFRYHIARGNVAPLSMRAGGPRMDPAPFTDWLRTLGPDSEAIARIVGMEPGHIRRLLSGRHAQVFLDVVDRACLNAGASIDDIYPLDIADAV